MKEDKILITGPGRCGTTILVKLLSLIGLDTGFQHLSDKEIELSINQQSRGGLEHYLNNNIKYPTIVKAPQFYNQLSKLNDRYNLIQIYVPIRSLEVTAKSREKHGNNAGGLWEATTVKEQMNHNAKVIYEITLACAQNDISLKFIDFNRFMQDYAYAFNICQGFANLSKSTPIMIEKFIHIYNTVIDVSKITTK